MKVIKRYKDYFDKQKKETGMPNTGMTELKKKLDEKTDNLISIIRHCDYFRESYQSTQSDLRKSFEKDEELLNEK